MKRAAVLGAAVLAVLAAAAWFWRDFAPGRPLALLDPAHIVVVRTPGGMLEVAGLQKVEEFGWSSRFTCPLVACPPWLTPTISRVRVRAHYTWRVPLAAEWTLRLHEGRYELRLPPLQLQEPVAFDTADLEIRTERGWFSPGTSGNREQLLRHLGPELARRGRQPAYEAAQRAAAERTVQEFARRWMGEQQLRADRPITVIFGPPAAAH